ncbi:MAG TPA: hypothetical protein VK501_20995 [Baekduia sp.]|uniref:hypothetical protein n=1 Tax=Baekduia sp. TaxID=2600305 RepID=UPI002B6EC284|nr:hypothetical protein [Baekduia sp.]HMJ36393.1 hypothetical protein [Baekduia sp.]
MRTRTKLAGGVAVAAVAVAGAVAILGGGDTVSDVAAPLGLTEHGPFRIRLSGPLWNDRTLRDQDGSRDLAYLTRDEPLTIAVEGRDGARIASIGLRVEGAARQVLDACRGATCPTAATVTAHPALQRLGHGSHHLTVDVRGPQADQRAGVRMELTVGPRLPPVREGDPVPATAAPPPPTAYSADLGRRVRALVGREQRVGVLRGVLGATAPIFVQIGELGLGGRGVGVTALLELAAPRRNVRATVPGYLATAAGYRLQSVSFTAVELRDLLVDLDLRGGRVIAAEPGPASQTSRWDPDQAPTPTGAGDED